MAIRDIYKRIKVIKNYKFLVHPYVLFVSYFYCLKLLCYLFLLYFQPDTVQYT